MNAAPASNGARQARGTQPARTLPHNEDLEQSIIGGILIEPATLAMVDHLESRDFYDHRHVAIWSAIRNLAATATPIDVLTVELALEKAGKLDAVGGIAYLGHCAARVPIVSNVIEYAKQVKAMSTLRRLMLITSHATERGYVYTDDVRELLGETIRDLQDLDAHHHNATAEIPYISPGRALEELARMALLPIYDTPFPTLNEALGTGGVLGSYYYTITAHTGVGKTSCVAKIANHVGWKHDVLVATWEMMAGYFVARMAAPPLGVSSNAIIRNEVPGGQVLGAISPGVIFLEEPSIELLHRAAEDLKRRRNGIPPLIIVDYLQLMAESIAQGLPNRDAKMAVTIASSALRAIAKSVGSPILAVSATSRTTGKELAQDVRKRAPVELVGAGRDSGSIEYDGAGVIVLSISDEEDLDGQIATITVAKSRFGQKMHIDARFLGATGDWLDCGRVAYTPKKAETGKAPAAKDGSDLRTAIAFVLRKAGVVPTKNKLVELTGRTRAHVLKEVDAMVESGIVRITAFGYSMSDAPLQTELHEAVREVES